VFKIEEEKKCDCKNCKGLSQRQRDVSVLIVLGVTLVLTAIGGYFFIQNAEAVSLHPCQVCVDRMVDLEYLCIAQGGVKYGSTGVRFKSNNVTPSNYTPQEDAWWISNITENGYR
tara:strand:- start:2047 stop:2391 length:345 start_codon:yes stop_codon:yes gene_type:complete